MRNGDGGFAFVELLLVVALVLIVSATGLRAIAGQLKAAEVLDTEVASIFVKEGAEWGVVKTADGGRVWVRAL